MSTLTVVRHGQASFLADNYDRLSPLGEQQARRLGEYWLARGVRFDRVVYGPCERQIRTGEIIADLYRAAGLGWPEPVSMPEFDEYPAEPVMRRFLPELAGRHPHLAELQSQFQAATGRSAKQRVFDKVLRDVSHRWLAGEVSAPDIPSWADFCNRIAAAVERVKADAPRSSASVVFTSAGPKAATARLALGLGHESTLELTWSARNAAFSEFLFTPERFSLHTFNNTPHLDSPDLITYR